eukprot:13398483-Heterocapsa_arctica.AAC.1
MTWNRCILTRLAVSAKYTSAYRREHGNGASLSSAAPDHSLWCAGCADLQRSSAAGRDSANYLQSSEGTSSK